MPALSLVAVDEPSEPGVAEDADGRVGGHVLFTEVDVDGRVRYPSAFDVL